MSRLKQREKEDWRVHPIYTDYEISSLGRVRRATDSKPGRYGEISRKKGRLLKPAVNNSGRLVVLLYISSYKTKMMQVHRLVLETFVGPCPENCECNHKDGNYTKNKVGNLEWVTRSENIKHSYEIGMREPVQMKGEENPFSILKEEEVLKIKGLLSKKVFSYREIGNIFGVSRDCIGDINRGHTWKHLDTQ
jgi:hypothetical protein